MNEYNVSYKKNEDEDSGYSLVINHKNLNLLIKTYDDGVAIVIDGNKNEVILNYNFDKIISERK